MTTIAIILGIARTIQIALQLYDRWRRYKRRKRLSARNKRTDNAPPAN